MKKIFVGNLSFTAREDMLRSLFEKYGLVERVNVVTHRESGRPRGFGFVAMANDAEAVYSRFLIGDGKPVQERPLPAGPIQGNLAIHAGPRRRASIWDSDCRCRQSVRSGHPVLRRRREGWGIRAFWVGGEQKRGAPGFSASRDDGRSRLKGSCRRGRCRPGSCLDTSGPGSSLYR